MAGIVLEWGGNLNSSLTLYRKRADGERPRAMKMRFVPPKRRGRSRKFPPWYGQLSVTRRTEKRIVRSGFSLEPTEADREKDASMSFRQVVYTSDDWTRHRGSTRHSRHILSIASSRVIRSLGPPVLTLTLISAAVAAFNEAVLCDLFPVWVPLLHAPALPFQLTAPALALLLVFRTNASYARFDEARKAWGSNVNRSRNFARQALSWIRNPADSEKLSRLLRYCVEDDLRSVLRSCRNSAGVCIQIALPFCLKNHLSGRRVLKEELSGLLCLSELEVLFAASHQPNYILQTMSELVNTCRLSDMERALLDRNLTQFHENLGTCERIFMTPIPLSYTRLTSRFLVLWHAALPFALWDDCGWVVIPATFFSAGALFCIEEVGVLIEEPIPLLALDNICTSIRENVDGLVNAHADNLVLNKKLSKKDESARILEVNGILKQNEES